METARRVVLAVAAVVVVVTVATGPFGPLTVSNAFSGAQAPGTGNATVTVVTPPGQPTLEPGRQEGSDVYYLRVPDAGVEVSDLRGNPILTYSIEIEAFGYTHSSVHFLGEVGEGSQSISLSRSALEASRVENDSYRAQVELAVRRDGTERTVYTATTTVETER